MSVSISAVVIIAVILACFVLVRVGIRQDRGARSVRPRPGARSTLAITAFVLAFLIPPIGVLLGHISLFRIGTGNATGRQYAYASLWIGYIVLVGELLVFLIATGTQTWF